MKKSTKDDNSKIILKILTKSTQSLQDWHDLKNKYKYVFIKLLVKIKTIHHEL